MIALGEARGAGIIVAIADTGIDRTHPDVKASAIFSVSTSVLRGHGLIRLGVVNLSAVLSSSAKFLTITLLVWPVLPTVPKRSVARCSIEAVQHSPADPLRRDRLLAAAKAGGDYLIRMQLPDGSFHYYYNAARDRFEARTYNIVRHAGTAMSLLDLYAATRDRRYLETARRAIRFLKTRFHSARNHTESYVLDFDGKAKLGANGLALVALTREIELDPKSSSRKDAVRLANLIVSMQRSDGSFEMRYRVESGDAEASESLYYPGEAMLGMIRLFKLNGGKRLLESARRGADFLIESQRRMGVLPADAWLMQALEALYEIGREKRYANHTIALAEAMMSNQYIDDEQAGYSGGFGPGSPRATPAASRAEGLVSAYRVARSENDARGPRIASSLQACASFQLAQQFTRDSASLPNPKRAAGGFREGLTSSRIRIDFVQHNISSLLRVAEALY